MGAMEGKKRKNGEGEEGEEGEEDKGEEKEGKGLEWKRIPFPQRDVPSRYEGEEEDVRE
jgi:hypothetical protein